MGKDNHITDILHLHFIVVILGFTGILGKLITLSAIEMVWYRMLFATAGLFIWLKWSGKMIVPQRRFLLKYLATGFIVALHWVAFFGSIKSSTVSVALACFASTTLFTSLLEPVFNKAKISLSELLLGMVIIIAIIIIFKFESGYSLGIILGLISAITGALFMVLNKGYQVHHKPVIITLFEMAGGFIALSFFLPFYNLYSPVSLALNVSDLVWLLILALVCTAYAFMASIHVMRSLSAFQVVLTINLEPVYGIFLAYLVFRESELMTPGFYFGTAILIAAVFAYSLLKRKPRSVNL
ncbi:DMT family transporter [Saccharicrinis sp. FJH54]|uniref:DMT family transporter n=1 Tax=Saccharicrinis sp. FJH54 TaxID=3344665 RepID=UPI0035D42FFF